jgi:hypothetical protein
MEVAAAKPKEGGFSSRHILCVGGTFLHKALAASGLLIEKLLMVGALLAFVGSMLVKELLATSSLLAVVSSALVEEALGSTLVKKVSAIRSLLFFVSGVPIKKDLAGLCLLAMALVLPQFLHSPFPVPVGGLLASVTFGKNQPPQWRQWEQPYSLLVLVQGTAIPIVWGIVDPVENLVRSMQRRLNPFVLQPSRRIGGVG